MYIAGEDLALISKIHRRRHGLSAGGRAEIQHPHSGPQLHHIHRQPRRRILHLHQPLPKGGQPGNLSRAANQKAARFPGMGRYLGPLGFQMGFQSVGIGFQGVDLDAGFHRAVVRLQNCAQTLAHRRFHQIHQLGGMAVANGIVLGWGQLVLAAKHIPEDGVAKSRFPLRKLGFRLLYRLVHRSGIRHTIQHGDLIDRQPQDIPKGGLQMLPAREKPVDIIIQQRPVLQHAAAKGGAQRRILPVQPRRFDLLPKHRVGPGAPGSAEHQCLSCRLSCWHSLTPYSSMVMGWPRR